MIIHFGSLYRYDYRYDYNYIKIYAAIFTVVTIDFKTFLRILPERRLLIHLSTLSYLYLCKIACTIVFTWIRRILMDTQTVNTHASAREKYPTTA